MEEGHRIRTEQVGDRREQTFHQRRETGRDIGVDESFGSQNVSHTGLLFANDKATYDAHQENMRVILDPDHVKNLNQVALQALQNAVNLANKVAVNSAETDNMVGKQAIQFLGFNKNQILRHQDIAADAQLETPSEAVAESMPVREMNLDASSLQALKALIVEIVENKTAGNGTEDKTK